MTPAEIGSQTNTPDSDSAPAILHLNGTSTLDTTVLTSARRRLFVELFMDNIATGGHLEERGSCPTSSTSWLVVYTACTYTIRADIVSTEADEDEDGPD
jgi:hypothetical protein